MVFNATFDNVSDILWQAVLLVDETGVPGENHRYVTSHWQTWLYNIVLTTCRHEQESISHLLVNKHWKWK